MAGGLPCVVMTGNDDGHPRQHPETLEVGEGPFRLMKVRHGYPVAVYTNGVSFLRVGPAELIRREVDVQRRLWDSGGPVPEIIAQGVVGDRSYFIETRVGSRSWGDVFAAESQAIGSISRDSLSAWMGLTVRFLGAQQRIELSGDLQEFWRAIEVDELAHDLPKSAGMIQRAVVRIESRLSGIPLVYIHGDFNPHNILEGGVVDFENSGRGPLGYDIVSNATNAFFFPVGSEFEMCRTYELSGPQLSAYFENVDLCLSGSGLAPVSSVVDELIMLRAIRATRSFPGMRRLRRWRQGLFQVLLDHFSCGRPLLPMLRQRADLTGS